MKKISIFLAFLVIFCGCSQKVFVHEPLKNELLAYTSKSKSVINNEKILILGTYLNPIHKSVVNEAKDEKFIISIYPYDLNVNLKSFAVNEDLTGVLIREINDRDEILSLVSVWMPWGRHFEITSPQKLSDHLNLSFEIYPSERVSLSFRKVSKSMYWN